MEVYLKKYRKLVISISILVTVLTYIKLGFFTDRTVFSELLISFFLAFIAYFVLYRLDVKFTVVLGLAILFRLVFLFSIPELSDDYFRFIWDGLLSLNGINPFLELPSYYMEQGLNQVKGLDASLYHSLNSPNYFTIYPPVNQLTFAIGAFGFKLNGYGFGVTLMRLVILLGEGLTVFYLIKICKHLGVSTKNVLLYALNPLIIVELVGNLHFEALMISFLCMAIYYLLKQKYDLSAVLFALAVNTKLLPLMFLPLFWNYIGWKKSVRYYLIVGGLTIIFFMPFLSVEMLSHLSKSVNLYFKSFEFNASLYYLIRWIGFQLVGYNIIGIAGRSLSILVLGIILYMSFHKKNIKTPLLKRMFWAFAIYLVCATVVHPWYISTLVFFSVFLPYRFALIWSGMALLSYAAYQTEAYIENLWLVAIEYVMVFGFLWWEIKKKKIHSKRMDFSTKTP